MTLKCSLLTLSEPTRLELRNSKPFPAEVSRTIMELASVGTLSTLNQEGSPLGMGARFAVDPEGTPVLCLNATNGHFSIDSRSNLHVQDSPGCALPSVQFKEAGGQDPIGATYFFMEEEFGEEVDEDLIHIVAIERVLQMEDLQEDGVWVSSLDYRNAQPDPLQEFAEEIVNVINTNNMEDITRFCNVYVDLKFQVSEAKMIWVDRLGFDVRFSSPQKGVFEVRIPFPREVTDEKGAKSTFNCLSQLAWEVEKNFRVWDFEKVKQLKHIKF